MSNRILIVDEVATNRILLKVKLSAAGYDVLQAPDLDTARELMRDGMARIVILSDRMGGAAGVEGFLREVTGDPLTATIPVIVVGAARRSSDRLTLLAAGAADHLTRPLDDAALLARVRSLLRSRSRELAEEMAVFEVAPGAGLDRPGRIGLIGADRNMLLRWKMAMEGRMADEVVVFSPDTLFEELRDTPAPGLFLLAADNARLRDLRLVAELKARPETEAAPILMIGAGSDPEFAIMALDLGAADVLPAGFDLDEVTVRVRARLKQVRSGERRRMQLAERLRQANTDALTGLPNRRAVHARLSAIASEAEERRPYALMILDIDRFKQVNDTHGHAAGDSVLAEVARRLSETVRGETLLGRIGGEEFLVALPATTLLQARMVAERLRRVIEATPVVLPGGDEVFVTLSIGLCLSGATGIDVEQMFDRADQALYAAKERGRNTVTIGRPAA